MRILIVHSNVIPVKLYGGTERMIWSLGKELVKMGHELVFLVKSGSYCDFARVININENQSVIDQIPDGIDLVHFFSRPADIEKIKLPFVITTQGNRGANSIFDRNTIFVSRNHALRYGSESFIYNGIDWDDYTAPDLHRERRHFHFLAKAAWKVKNVKGAINVINKTKSEKLEVLGGVRFNFKMGIRFTFSPKVRFRGMIGGTDKDQLLNGSKGLLFPVRWHEPFGIAITESLYYGCPVFGTPYGSLPELVKEDVGFLTYKEDEMLDAILNSNVYSRKRCHEYARDEFNSKIMAQEYLARYEKVINGEFLNKKQPKLQKIQDEKFLRWEQ